MEIKKSALAGTLESGDVQVLVEPAVELAVGIDSNVMEQFGGRIKEVVMETLTRLAVESGRITVIDRGAFDYAIMARLECAIFRAAEYRGDIPWGGMIR